MKIGILGHGAKVAPRKWAALAALLIASFAASYNVAPALAGTAVSSIGVLNEGGRQFQNQATIITSSSSAVGRTRTWPVGFTAQAGWVGSQGRLYGSTGGALCQGAMSYNAGSLASGAYKTNDSCNNTAPGTYHSQGNSDVWNGSGYTNYGTFVSPNQNG